MDTSPIDIKDSTTAAAPTPTLYKVLRDGASCHGGRLWWPLPTDNGDGTWTPGAWVSVQGRLVICQNALHLTDQPASWYQPEAQCWVAEYRGEMVGALDGRWESKIGVREARLLRPVAWDDVAVWTEGQHHVTSGAARASGSATVRASGSATVEASDSATVRASGSATVEAFGSATVEASGSATVRASGSATVEASGSATVEAFGSATVRASGSATVRAFDSATCISDPWHSASAQVALANLAAHVDRRGGTLVLRSASEARS